jgi:hypothetical protein
MSLTFKFGWTTGNKGLKVSVGELIVGALGVTPTRAEANWMTIDPLNPARVNHTARLVVAQANSTVQYPNPLKPTQLLNHTWTNQVVNFYYPSGYNLTKITANNTLAVYSGPTSGPPVPFETERCSDGPICTQALIALNMSDLKPTGPLMLRNTNFTLTSLTRNTLYPTNPAIPTVTTGFGNFTSTYFEPGDNMTVKVVNRPSTVNMTTTSANPSLIINFTGPMGNTTALTAQSFSTTTGGLFGFTLPQGPFGLWNASVVYQSNFDFGASWTRFNLDQLSLSPQTVTPTVQNGMLVISGRILNATSKPAQSVSGTLFAADASSGPIPITSSNMTGTGLYISNVTLVNGVFTRGQTLTGFFTVVNSNTTTPYNNVMLNIQHEFASGQLHATNVTIPLTLGDEPFVSGKALYKMEITITQTGVQARVTSMQTNRFTPTLTLKNNSSSPVIPSRQQTGLFKLTLTTTNGTIIHVASIESPPYAYVLSGPETSSGYLAHSTPFTTTPDGNFTATLPANETVGAGKLVIFALARDIRGLTLWNGSQDPTSVTDNTRLVTSADRIGELTVGQSATATLHLKNNSTRLPQSITVDLWLGSTKVDSKSVSLQPGQSTTVQYNFKAPSTPGSYTLTYSSGQYRGPLATQTIQVVLVPGLVQLLIPLIIGVVAAIAVLGYYLFRSRRVTTTTTTTSTKTTTKTTKTP